MTNVLLPSIDALPLSNIDFDFFHTQEEKAKKYFGTLFPQNQVIQQVPTFKNNEIKVPFKAKGAWSFEEDEMLRAAVSNCDPILWDVVAESVPGRTAIQCKERWLYRLHPEVKKTRFEKWEDDIIINERNRVGNHWTLIANKLPGRTSCAVKNRWYSVLRNRQSLIE